MCTIIATNLTRGPYVIIKFVTITISYSMSYFKAYICPFNVL
jgi:hypothetical protein